MTGREVDLTNEHVRPEVTMQERPSGMLFADVEDVVVMLRYVTRHPPFSHVVTQLDVDNIKREIEEGRQQWDEEGRTTGSFVLHEAESDLVDLCLYLGTR